MIVDIPRRIYTSVAKLCLYSKFEHCLNLVREVLQFSDLVKPSIISKESVGHDNLNLVIGIHDVHLHKPVYTGN